ncbi:MAG TPA: HAD family phosphatase [Treponemataceae bacterium]|nr:HAD family phosphatase [Treponemataceae bacterium]
MHREVIAFFDIDHTISRKITTVAFIFECMRRGYIKIWYLLAAPFLYIAYRFFSIKVEVLFQLSLPKLHGISRTEFEDIGRVSFEKHVKKYLYSGALQEMETLRSRGLRVILATSSPFEAVYPLAQYCGISAGDVIATQFAYTDGVFDGKLIGVPVFSRFKCSIIKNFAEKSGTDLHNCSFYSDSIHDLPLLELVGHPVAANPDLRLRRIAKKRGWTIKEFAR